MILGKPEQMIPEGNASRDRRNPQTDERHADRVIQLAEAVTLY